MLEILAITGPIFIVIGLGFLAVRLEVFTKPDVRVMGKFVVNFALPALLFKALSQRSLADVMSPSYMIAYGLGSLLVLTGGLCLAHFVQKKNLQRSALMALGMSFSNTGFIGYPIALQAVGPAAAEVALALALVVENMMILPLTLILAESGANKGNGKKLSALVRAVFISLFKNPMILAILAGAGFALLEIRPPEPLKRAIDMLALASGPVALFVIGGTLVGLRVRGMLPRVSQIAFGKLILHPLAVLLLFLLLPPVDPALRLAGVILASAPMLSIYPILAQKYGEEGNCAAALLATTVTSFLTISGVLWAMRHLLPA